MSFSSIPWLACLLVIRVAHGVPLLSLGQIYGGSRQSSPVPVRCLIGMVMGRQNPNRSGF